MESLQDLCYKTLAENILKAPEFLQEQIYKHSIDHYRKEMRKSIKKELLEELRVEISEDLLEEYMGVVPCIIEEAVDLSKYYDRNEIEQYIRINNSYIDEDILGMAIECFFKMY